MYVNVNVYTSQYISHIQTNQPVKPFEQLFPLHSQRPPGTCRASPHASSSGARSQAPR